MSQFDVPFSYIDQSLNKLKCTWLWRSINYPNENGSLIHALYFDPCTLNYLAANVVVFQSICCVV